MLFPDTTFTYPAHWKPATFSHWDITLYPEFLTIIYRYGTTK